MGNEFQTVYGWMIRTRATLLDFLGGLPWETLARPAPDVGRESVRGMLLHIAGCYRWWIEYFAGAKAPPSDTDEPVADLPAIQAEFAAVDRIVGSFAAERSASPDTPFTLEHPGLHAPFTTTARWLFTHTTTHEFHHKGQIVMLCRRFGHPPVETDLWEPSWGAGQG
jgi:uncharacterized damage-inducible protein DinB